MSKEQQELLDEAYKNYVNKTKFPGGDTVPKIEFMYHDSAILTQEEFINKCKTDTEFAKHWGLKIYTKVDGDKVWMGMVYNDNAVEIRLK
jgi:hypothetical protein